MSADIVSATVMPWCPKCMNVWDGNVGDRCPTCAPDMVNRPPHYTTGKIEVLDFIEDQQFGYLDGQVIKYVARHRHKGAALEDLRKARFYLDRLIARTEAAE